MSFQIQQRDRRVRHTYLERGLRGPTGFETYARSIPQAIPVCRASALKAALFRAMSLIVIPIGVPLVTPSHRA